MIKSILQYLLVFLLIGIGNFNLHQFWLYHYDYDLSFKLKPVYVFFFVSSLFILIGLELLSRTTKYKPQIGFLYLATLLIKIVLFTIIFYNPIFNDNELTKKDSLNLLIPLIFSLFLEVFYLSKILNKG